MQFPINMTPIELYWREDSRPQSFWRGLTYAILWPPDVKNWLIWEDPDAGKDWRQEEKGTTEDEMVGWHHQFNGHGFGWTPGVGDGQGGLACCDSWGCKESDTTEQLNWTELNWLDVRASEVQDCLGAPGPHGKTGQWPWSTQGCFCVAWSRKMSSCWHFSGKWNRCRKYSQRRYHPLEALALFGVSTPIFLPCCGPKCYES